MNGLHLSRESGKDSFTHTEGYISISYHHHDRNGLFGVPGTIWGLISTEWEENEASVGVPLPSDLSKKESWK